MIKPNRQQKGDMGILHHEVSDSAEHKGWVRVPYAEGIYGLRKIDHKQEVYNYNFRYLQITLKCKLTPS